MGKEGGKGGGLGLGLHDGEDDVGAPVDAGEGDGGDHDNEEVEEPVGAGGERVGWGADSERDDFGRVEPCLVAVSLRGFLCRCFRFYSPFQASRQQRKS